ncbi:UPF3 regulator of nonsense mediated mRNA decay isoform X2 [Oratosquilla oratoria]|uniref:UPF3 regulator of nonsense mediated mRNA decay isoform X2 n=1 Tax=Oratosquilla oratoria TaxID=337810 RepID=UPI003F774E4B
MTIKMSDSGKKDSKASSEGSSRKNTDGKDSSRRKEKASTPVSKIVVRRLPPGMTEEEFCEAVSPLPENDYFAFITADRSLGPNAFTRVYINFRNSDDVFTFRDQFDGYVFVDQKGNEYQAMVEYAPFQKIPKRPSKKRDLRCGTIDQDQDYLAFVETLTNPPPVNLPQMEQVLEEIEAQERALRANGQLKMKTPLLEYIEQRKAEKLRNKEEKKEERRRKELERKKAKEADKKKKEMKDMKKKEDWKDEDSVKVVSRPDRLKDDGYNKGRMDKERDKQRRKEDDRQRVKERERDKKDREKRDKEKMPRREEREERLRRQQERSNAKDDENQREDMTEGHPRHKVSSSKREAQRCRKQEERARARDEEKMKIRKEEMKGKDDMKRESQEDGNVVSRGENSKTKRYSEGRKREEREKERRAREEMEREKKLMEEKEIEHEVMELVKTAHSLTGSLEDTSIELTGSSENVDMKGEQMEDVQSQGDEEPNQGKERTKERHRRDPRTERRIRNKDRPAMALYRPGQSRLSSRIRQSQSQDEGDSSSSPSPVMQGEQKLSREERKADGKEDKAETKPGKGKNKSGDESKEDKKPSRSGSFNKEDSVEEDLSKLKLDDGERAVAKSKGIESSEDDAVLQDAEYQTVEEKKYPEVKSMTFRRSVSRE